MMHSSMINDVDWAPIAGRSFHLVVTCAKDKMVIVWRIVMMDIFLGEVMEQPQVEAIQCIDQSALNNTQIQRVKWNILGTSFATSSDDGDVKLWQRAQPQLPSSLSAINASVHNNEIEFRQIGQDNHKGSVHQM